MLTKAANSVKAATQKAAQATMLGAVEKWWALKDSNLRPTD
jgi:hypothetical protein